MSQAFFDYVRGHTDVLPAGHDPRGMRAYRYLVWLGAAQMVQAHYPGVRERLGEAGWDTLISAFVRHSTWTSPFYGDLIDAFEAFIARESA